MIISTIFRNRTTQKILRVVVPLAFWLGAWQLAAIWVDTVYTPGHGALLLPSPLQVWERLAALAARPSFWRTAAVSLGRIFGGFALGAAVGTLLAVITSALSWADWLFRPMVKVIRAVPVASFIVLALLWALFTAMLLISWLVIRRMVSNMYTISSIRCSGRPGTIRSPG